MATEKICFKDYIECKDDKKLSKTRKKVNRKRKDGSSKNVYGWAGYGPPPNLSGGGSSGVDGSPGATAGAAVGESADIRRLGYKAPPSSEKAEPTRLHNAYKYGKNNMKFLDYLEDEDEEEFNPDIDPEEPVGKDPYEDDEDPYEDEDAGFDKDIWDLIDELRDEGLSVEDIADDTDMSVEDIEAYIDHFEGESDGEDEYRDEEPRDEDESGDEEDLSWMDEFPEDEEDEDPFVDQDEEDDYNNILAAFARNRERGDEVEDFMSARDEDEFPEDEEDTDDEDLSDDEYERRYDVERDEDEDQDEDFGDEDEPEYADEVTVGGWTISRLDDEDFDDEGFNPDEDEDYDPEFDPDYDEDQFDIPNRDDFDADSERGYEPRDEEDYEYAEDAEEPSQKDQARALYRAMSSGEYSRKDIIGAFEKRLGLSPSSATAYYQRIAKEYGETEQPGDQDTMGAPGGMGMGDQSMMNMMGDEAMQGEAEPEFQEPKEWEDPHRQGVIRNVKGAHLVYKRQDDDGSFEELWIYKEGDKFQDELSVRHDILAGTDIPVNKTQSPDGSQKAETWAVGNVQYMSITGLPN